MCPEKSDIDLETGFVYSDSVSDDMHIGSEETAIPVDEFAAEKESRFSRIFSGCRKFFSIASAVLVVLLTIFMGVIIFWKPITEFLHLNRFKSAREHFVYVESKAAGEFVNTIAGTYGNMLARACSERSALKYDLQIELGDQLVDAFNADFPKESIMNENWIKDISLSIVKNRYLDDHYTSLSLCLDDYSIVSPSYYWSSSKDKVWICIPEISKAYLEMNADNYFQPYDFWNLQDRGIDAEEFTSFTSALPSEQVFVQLLKKYSDIIFYQITNVDTVEEVITVGDLEEKCTVLTATITERQWISTLISLMQFAREDELLNGLYVDMGRFFDFDSSDKIISYTDRIDAVLEDLNAAFDEASAENYIQWIDYVSDTEEIIGRRIRVSGSEKEFSYATIFDGNEVYCEFNLFDMISGFGGGKLSGIILDARFDIFADQSHLCTIEVENLNCRNYKSGRVVGNFRITTDKDQIYELEVEQKSDGLYLMLNVLSGNTSIIKLTFDSNTQEPKNIQLPNEVFSASDENDLAEWILTCNLEPLIRNLERAGAPENYTEPIEAFWVSLSSLQ